MKAISKFFLLFLTAAALVFTACPNPNGGDDDDGDGIKWSDEASGTLTVTNNVSKDMVLFQGQTPSASNILGGVRGLATKTFDISDDVDDFNTGGYIILRGMTLDEYKNNKNNLSLAKVEYSAMATYGQGKKFRAEISPNYAGDYGYKVTNIGKIGMELRKDSPDGEKIGYLPSLSTNVMLYASTTAQIAIYPVYVFFNKSTQQVTTLKPTTVFEQVNADPRPLANASGINSYIFPADEGATWDNIKSSLTSPVAYFTVNNNVSNQGSRFTLAGTNSLISQNGYDGVASGEQLTFEVESTPTGTQKNIIMTLYSGAIQVPVRFEGQSTIPTIKNGYDYTVTLSGSGQNASGYTAVLTESAGPRDLSDAIESL
jgi:hypothetical protein